MVVRAANLDALNYTKLLAVLRLSVEAIGTLIFLKRLITRGSNLPEAGE